MQPSGTELTFVAFIQPSDTELAYAIQILLFAINPPATITTINTGPIFLINFLLATTIASTGYIPIFFLKPPAITTLLVLAPFATLSVSLIPSSKAPISTFSALPTLALVEAFTILPSTTTVLLLAILQTSTRLVFVLNFLLAINFLAAMTTTNTSHGKEFSNSAKIYTNKRKYCK